MQKKNIIYQIRKLIGSGWRYPLEHHGLVEEELDEAQMRIDANLNAPSFKVESHETAAFLRKFDCHEDFKADNGFNRKDEVSAVFLVHEFLRKALSDNVPNGINKVISDVGPLALAQLPNWVRYSKGQPAFGETHVEKTIHAALFFARFMFMAQLLLFGYIAAHDFNRRRVFMNLMGKMLQWPGVLIEDVLVAKDSKGVKKDAALAKQEAERLKKNGSGSEKVYMEEANGDETVESAELGSLPAEDVTTVNSPEIKGLRLYIDLRKRSNAFAWVLSRRTLKVFGFSYFKRIQAYVGVLFFWAISAMIILNALFWNNLNHYISTPIYIISATTMIALCVLAAVSEATKLQQLALSHRMLLKNEVFAIDQTLASWTVGHDDGDDDFTELGGQTLAYTNLMSPERKSNIQRPTNFARMQEATEKLHVAKNIIGTADALIGYQEEVFNPINVMGVHATNGVYNSTIGILLTFLVLALEGSSGGLAYNPLGWCTQGK